MPITKLTDVSSKYGAPRGRRDVHAFDPNERIKFHLAYVPFIDGCYDRGGAYWGSPANLWRVVSAEEVLVEPYPHATAEFGRVELFYRANTRDEVKAYVREDYPNATFFR